MVHNHDQFPPKTEIGDCLERIIDLGLHSRPHKFIREQLVDILAGDIELLFNENGRNFSTRAVRPASMTITDAHR